MMPDSNPLPRPQQSAWCATSEPLTFFSPMTVYLFFWLVRSCQSCRCPPGSQWATTGRGSSNWSSSYTVMYIYSMEMYRLVGRIDCIIPSGTICCHQRTCIVYLIKAKASRTPPPQYVINCGDLWPTP